MRIVLDFQACQSGSRYRGVGRGSRSLMLSMAQRLIDLGDDVFFLLNAAFIDEHVALEDDLLTQIPRAQVKLFHIISPCAAAWPENAWRQMAARIIREHAIACLEADFVHVPALLADGWGDDSVGSVGLLGVNIPVSLTQHDLIPLAMEDIYMPPGPFRDYYLTKLEGAKKADLFLAISEYSRKEALEYLGVPENVVVNISSAAESESWKPEYNESAINSTLSKLRLSPGFLLYAPGGFDYRKNLDRLSEAYALLPPRMRAGHQLVIASKLDPGRREILNQSMASCGLDAEEVVLTDYVSDEELKHLYSSCFAYVFPSLHEGFGLPALEAMSCGAPVIASSRTSIPEVVGMDEALFDPTSARSIADKIMEVIQDEEFRKRLLAHAVSQPKKFSWEKSAEIAIEAIERRHAELKQGGWQPTPAIKLPDCDMLLKRVGELVPDCMPSTEDITIFKKCFESNLQLMNENIL
jgi:glycosyltransferase involved in cell wall biosynthesis